MSLVVLTELLRRELIKKYLIYMNASVLEDEMPNIDKQYLEFIKIENSKYANKVILNFINNSKYKKIFYLVLLQDSAISIKIKKLKSKKIDEYEDKLLYYLFNLETNTIIKLLEKDEELLLDFILLFLEYNLSYSKKEKYNNISLLDKTTDIGCLKKFKVYFLDNVQYEYDKLKY